MKLKLVLVLILVSSQPILPWGEHLLKIAGQAAQTPAQSAIAPDRVVATTVAAVVAVASAVCLILTKGGRR